ncbi:MAG: hypothetical protein ACI3Z7_04710 [Candidatus Aphodosoma sp.]
MNISAKRLYALVSLLLCCAGIITAQNNTNSPYTRYGYGHLEDNCFSMSQAMGGAAVGIRNRISINPVNPASYSSIDSTTFIFEMGVSGLLSNFSTGTSYNTKFTGNLDYVALQMPITKWMGLSAGLIPFSYVGYQYSTNDSIKIPASDKTNKYMQSYSGAGGISQVYLGISFDIANHFSIGANAYYMFGNMTHYRALSYTSSELTPVNTIRTSNLHTGNFNGRFGIQYHETVDRKHAFTIGAIYEFKSPISGTHTYTTEAADTITSSMTRLFDLPSLYGGGFSYTYDDRLTISADYIYQEFAKARFYGVTDTLCNRHKIALGAEYIHNPGGRRYADRVYWRIGANYRNSYIRIGNHATRDFSVTCGVGLPLRTSKTLINIHLEYGNIGSEMLLKENYVKLGVNFSLNEMWFVKAKIR